MKLIEENDTFDLVNIDINLSKYFASYKWDQSFEKKTQESVAHIEFIDNYHYT